ncbi:MAG TPA: FecR domain-containing protein [Pedobacter sp.]|uniref:FecR family protein n=1 Tax=Pedobacter sp. TaxID=1411316 RepID=UPI002B87759C|nr:FecR domain-containing protein [Pedobacter sp.]HMI01264.1 FecR domain-containing protein [Pedobacter sp.]
MKKLEAEELLEKYLEGKANQQECIIVESWYLDVTEDSKGPTPFEIDAAERKVWKQLSMNRKNNKNSRFWFRSVAAILILMSFGTYFYFNSTKDSEASLNVVNVSNLIKPGSNKAVLILANGKKVILADANTGEIAKQTGVSITKAANGQLVYTAIPSLESDVEGKANETQFNTIQTPAGGQYQVNLPDGTKVWLNASSSLKFPARFASTERRVELTGEGYFEVAKDKRKPFKVTTAQQEIMVFGTHFNVNAYTDEHTTKTTLLEGSVKVTADDNHSLFLKPGDQAVLRGNSIELRLVDVAAVIDWKNGLFVFDNDKIEAIMRRISRWYNVDIVYRGKVSEERFMGTISRYQDIKEVLNMLELTNLVHFRIEERRIAVMP